MDIDGANQKQLTDKFDLDPHVSPDGQWFVYESWSGKLTLWKMPVEGGQPVHLTETRSWLGLFSPDGKLILAFQSETDLPLRIAILPSIGGQPVKTFTPAKGVESFDGARTGARSSMSSRVTVFPIYRRRRFKVVSLSN